MPHDRSRPPGPPLTPDDLRALRALHAVLEQARARAERDGFAALSSTPALAALGAKIGPSQWKRRLELSRQLERDAIVDERWEGYLGHLTALGAMYGQLGVPFADWFTLISSYRPSIYEKILPPGADEISTVLAGMDRFQSLSMATIAMAYLETKEDLVRSAETQRDRYIDLFHNASLGMMIYEWSAPPDLGSFRAVEANPAAIAMFQRAAEQVLGHTLRESSASTLETEIVGHYAAAVEHGKSATWTIERGGRTFDARCFPMQGRYLGVMFEDVTHRRSLTEAVEQHARELERSNRDLDDFAYVASHDLKAPLRDIDNLASWIADDAAELLPEASKRHLALLQDRIARMERLLDDLLDYSRASRFHLPPEDFDVRAVIDEALRLISPQEGFEIVVVGDRPKIRTARVPLEQVIRNLVTNGIKHHHRKQGRITVRVVDAGPRLEISVTDDGPGIAPEFHQRVFRLFQTLRPRDEVEGSGMGLAIVKKVVESHGGAVKIVSALGEGTTIHFTWPALWPSSKGASP